MKQLAWNPVWVQAYESIVSVATKLAFVNTASVSDIASMLVGSTPTSRQPLWLPDTHSALNACQMLGIDISEAKRHFAIVGRTAMQDRASVRLALRWCPKCMEEHFHCALFQDMRRTRCPWHDEILRETCPRCARPVDPLKLDGWRCGNCRMAFAREPRDWIARFKTPLSRSAPCVGWIDKFSYVTAGDPASRLITIECNDQAAFGLEDWAQQHEREEAWIQWLVFEEVCAISDSLMTDHSVCLDSEWLASRLEFSPTRFDCPAAAAIINALAWIGPSSQELGGWPGKVRDQSCDYGLLLDAVLKVPRWVAPFVVRETARRWIADSLTTFAAAAREGQYALSWRPTGCTVCVGQTRLDSAVLPILTSESELASAIVKAAALCRCRTDNPKRRSWKRYRDATSSGGNSKITASTSPP